MEVAGRHGERFAGAGNRPIRLCESDALWLVVQGSVDVFATQPRDDGVPTDFKHLLRAGPGRLLFPVAEAPGLSLMVAKGLPNSELLRLPLTALSASELDSEIAAQADAWVREVADSIVRDVTYRPRVDQALAVGEVKEVAEGTTVVGQHGVVWASSPDGEIEYLSTEKLDESGTGMVPVTSMSWVVQQRKGSMRGISATELQRQGRLLAALADFNRVAMSADQLNRTLLLTDLLNLQVASARHRRKSEEVARETLFSVLAGDRVGPDSDSDLMRTLERIGRHEGIRFQSARRKTSDGEMVLEDFLNASGVRARRVALRADHRWWLGDSGALLASRNEDGCPVALIPGASGRYRMYDPQSGQTVSVTPNRAATLSRHAYFFYRPLTDEPLSGRTLLRVAFKGVWGDVVRLLGAGILSSLALLMPAVLLGILVNEALPTGDLRMLGMAAIAIALTAATVGLMEMMGGTALMRLEGRAAARVTAALLDRMLSLPSSFFRRYTVGDLGSRFMGLQLLRDQVSGVVSNALLSLVFLLPTFVLVFFYDLILGWLCLSLGLVSLAVTVGLGLRQVPLHRRKLSTHRHLTGVLIQMIAGAGKLRVTGTETSAFAMWADNYRKQKQTEMKLGAVNEHLVSFTSAVPTVAISALLAVGLNRIQSGDLLIGDFLVVVTAFALFLSSITRLGLSFAGIAAILPAAEQTKPILAESPRVATAGSLSPELKGELHIDHVSFRYTHDTPLVLSDVSIHAHPGEFIALVGESGAGKSTLLRLALGLESPLSGAVHYDGHNLERLHRRAVRDGVGMVVQDATLRPQTVLDNIIGPGDDLTIEDAWRAARLASVDNDIQTMPMGMYTITSEASSTFSGGQVQRIMLAAALVRNPSVLLLDEATNWLDNATQAQVMSEIEALQVTRVVSAHRLSTIRRADRIYALQDGQVVQEGTFDELMEQEGVFRAMALRQMA